MIKIYETEKTDFINSDFVDDWICDDCCEILKDAYGEQNLKIEPMGYISFNDTEYLQYCGRCKYRKQGYFWKVDPKSGGKI